MVQVNQQYPMLLNLFGRNLEHAIFSASKIYQERSQQNLIVCAQEVY